MTCHEHAWRWLSEEDSLYTHISTQTVTQVIDPEQPEIKTTWRAVNVICDKCGEKEWAHGRQPWPRPMTRKESRLLSKIGDTTSEEIPGTDLA